MRLCERETQIDTEIRVKTHFQREPTLVFLRCGEVEYHGPVRRELVFCMRFGEITVVGNFQNENFSGHVLARHRLIVLMGDCQLNLDWQTGLELRVAVDRVELVAIVMDVDLLRVALVAAGELFDDDRLQGVRHAAQILVGLHFQVVGDVELDRSLAVYFDPLDDCVAVGPRRPGVEARRHQRHERLALHELAVGVFGPDDGPDLPVLNVEVLRRVDFDFELRQHIFGDLDGLARGLLSHFGVDLPVAQRREVGQLQLGGEDAFSQFDAIELLDAVRASVLSQTQTPEMDENANLCARGGIRYRYVDSQIVRLQRDRLQVEIQNENAEPDLLARLVDAFVRLNENRAVLRLDIQRRCIFENQPRQSFGNKSVVFIDRQTVQAYRR